MSAPYTPPDHLEPRVVGALLLVQLFFGVHYVAAKELLRFVDPAAWALARVAAASLLLQALVLRRTGRLPRSAGDWARLAGFAACGVVINQACFVEGLRRTIPAHSSLIATTIPLWALAFAVLLRHERLTAWRTGGLLVALAGVLVLLRADRFRLEQDLLAGDLLTVVTSASYGLFLVVSRRYLLQRDPLVTTAFVFTLGTVGLLPYGLRELLAVEPGALPAHVLPLAAFIVVVPTVGAYALNLWALRRVASSLVALFIYLQPVIATVTAWALGGAPPTRSFLAASALVFGGVAMGVLGGRRRTSATA